MAQAMGSSSGALLPSMRLPGAAQHVDANANLHIARKRGCHWAAVVCQVNAKRGQMSRRAGGEEATPKRQGGTKPLVRRPKAEHASVEEPVSPASLLPAPPAGFVVNNRGEVVQMAPASSRVLTMVDDVTGLSLECNVRRSFVALQGSRCFVLSPLDMPIQILRLDHRSGVLAELTDEEMEDVLAQASYEMAKKSLHLVQTGYCLTARGALCFTPEAVINLHDEYNLRPDGEGTEGVEICYFRHAEAEYTVFTPFDPLVFVAYWDNAGCLRLAEDDALMSDPRTLRALQVEEEFSNMVEEEEDVAMALREW